MESVEQGDLLGRDRRGADAKMDGPLVGLASAALAAVGTEASHVHPERAARVRSRATLSENRVTKPPPTGEQVRHVLVGA